MRSIRFRAPVILLQIATASALSQGIGDKAPEFSLPYATKDSIARNPLTLSAIFSNSIAVIAFYPADWSSGCTKEVCAFRDGITDLSRLNVTVLAISGDYVYSHHEWAKYHQLPFRLLSDHDHAVAKEYGSYNESTGYNRRTVFVVDRSGLIAYADLNYSVRDTSDFRLLRAALDSLQPTK